MRLNNLDLNLLVALDHLIVTKSISQTAERMNLSQSAMSNALGRLRQYFDDPLLVRVGQKMELTVRAEILRPEIADVLTRIEAALAKKPDFDPKQASREFRLLVSDYSLHTIIPPVLELTAPFGDHIRFHFLRQTDRPNVYLERGEADLLLAPRIVCSPEHPSIKLFDDDYCCVAWRRGKYGREPLTRKAFAAAGHVRYLSSATGGALDSVLLDQLGITRRTEISTFAFSSVPHLVVGTDRIAVVHRRTAQLWARHLSISVLELPFPMERFEQQMQWHHYRSRDPGIIWIRDIFKKAAAKMQKK
ncbi:LysR family nod box-dependent transcriptional activator [Bradyrhizobium japonicum]|nr:LysR family transcriptional regulator [Bradyrhizobium elkanii USDA 76]GEC59237.1 transcriptional regulator [Bradyrhizobium elkanii]